MNEVGEDRIGQDRIRCNGTGRVAIGWERIRFNKVG